MLYLPDPDFTGRKFQKTKFFFDTSFLIYALGYSGSELQAPCTELLDLLYKNGAQLFCFRHTLDEIIGILSACAAKLSNHDESPFGRSIHYFMSKGYTTSDILLLISQLQRNIEELRIRIIEKPDYANHQYVIDEKKLSFLLRQKIAYKREEALLKDVDSISAIYRIRKGNTSFYYEDSDGLFVTTNNTLASVSNEFYFSENNQTTIPPCITDYQLTNIIWLKTPTQAPNLPVKRVIADSYASIQPDDNFMSLWFKQIDDLKDKGAISSDDYYFLRYSEEAIQSLMEVSFGDPEAITEGTIPEIIERAKKLIQDEAIKERDEEKSRRVDAENKIMVISTSHNINEIERLDRIRSKSRSFARGIRIALEFILIIILIIGLFLTTPWELISNFHITAITTAWPSFIVPLILIMSLLYGVLNSIFGISLNSIFRKFELFIDAKIFKLLNI